jgi:RND family efflux transporter MFP subunit
MSIYFRNLSCILVCLSITAVGCAKKTQELVEIPPPKVSVCKPISRKVIDYFPQFHGQVEAVEQVEVRAQVSGYIWKISFTDGQMVKKDDLLLEIDPRPYQAALDKALADVARCEALLVKSKADLARSEKLLPSGAISREEYDQQIAARDMAEAQLQASKAAVRDCQLNLDFTKIKAPIDGRISRAKITVGNLIQAGAGGSVVLTTIVSINPIYVYFDIDERTLLISQQSAREENKNPRGDHIKELQIPVEIGLDNEQGFPHQGVMDFVENKVDTGTGTIRVRAVFDNGAGYLTPGLFVRVRVPASDYKQALLVSESAIGTDRDKKFLLVVDKDNVAQYHLVRLGSAQGDLRVIEAGIGADDWVIVNGIQRVRPNMKVTPCEGPMPSLMDEENKKQAAPSPASKGN